MDKQTLILRLMETFLVEFEERLQSMNRDLLALEQGAGDQRERQRRLQSLFRDAHSLKGAARAVDVHLIEVSCHSFETILAAVQKDPELLSQPLLQLLFSAVDGLTEAGQLLRANQSLEGTLLAGISLELEMYIESCLQSEDSGGSASKERPAAPAPAPAPAPVPALQEAAPRPDVAVESAPSSPQEMFSVRIDAEKLDSLLSRSGELLGARQRLRVTADRLATLSDLLNRLQSDWQRVKQRHAAVEQRPSAGEALPVASRLQAVYEKTPHELQRLQIEIDQARLSFMEDWRLLDQAGTALDEQVRRVRMLPFSLCCVGFDRMVRDLARAAGKDAELQIEGGDVEIDRSILEGLKDPLRHLIRNAVDHGIEKPEDRQRSGKPPRGRIRASASLRGAQVQVLVSDDGQGLGFEAIHRRAQKMNLPLPKSERESLEIIFTPGFSTAAEGVTMVSGRGIGLDVVKTQIKSLHGEVEVATAQGQGTRFQLTVPLTLTLLRVLLVKAHKQSFAISNTYVHKLMRISRDDVLWIGERAMLLVGDKLVPLGTLAQVLGLPQPEQLDWPGKMPVVVLTSEERQGAFLVDELITEQEVMVKSLGPRVQRIRNIAGAVILSDGQVALALHVADLFQSAGVRASAGALQQFQTESPRPKKQSRILVVDDSVTTRTLERSLLESAGFLVEVATDGAQGWERVQAGGIDVVLSDVDMPNMNGYELTQTIRRSERYRTLPVVLITSNDDAASRQRGMRAGAMAYIVKGEFDQHHLLSLLEQLL